MDFDVRALLGISSTTFVVWRASYVPKCPRCLGMLNVLLLPLLTFPLVATHSPLYLARVILYSKALNGVFPTHLLPF